MIDFEGPVPLYQQVAGILRGRIESGTLVPDRPVPSITSLVQEFGVARGTARKAVHLLIDEGLAYVVIGRGVYVTRK
ncbi:MAG TPA: GntR family transcriptional regulator [Jiangellaceae bacterium]